MGESAQTVARFGENGTADRPDMGDMVRNRKPATKPISLALQGGGAIGAFTWGRARPDSAERWT